MFIALVLCFSAVTEQVHDHVDIWERNQLFNSEGKEYFVQHIFWRIETHDEVTDYYVSDWRMERDCNAIPQKTETGFVGTFRDRKDKINRVILAKQYLETESTVDYEVFDRDRLPAGKRSGLRKGQE